MTKSTTPTSNPFATRFTQPGRLEYMFANGDSMADLVSRLKSGSRWQVLGPHGTGKTTFLKSLISELESKRSDEVSRIHFYSLHDGQKKLPIERFELTAWDSNTIVIIDGYEQLRWLERRKLQRVTKKRQSTLLVTTHIDLDWPTLYETKIEGRIVEAIIEKLCPGFDQRFGSRVQSALTKQNGNVREVLFELYDIWNDQYRNQICGPPAGIRQ